MAGIVKQKISYEIGIGIQAASGRRFETGTFRIESKRVSHSIAMPDKLQVIENFKFFALSFVTFFERKKFEIPLRRLIPLYQNST
jgi:hypothetical protein